MPPSVAILTGTSAVALAIAAFAAAPAVAQVEKTVTVTGQADRKCTLGLPAQGDGALVNFDTPSGSVFSVTQLADPDTLSTQAANITLMMDAMCNGVHRIAFASDNNGLWREDADAAAPGFASAVPYEANLTWAAQPYRLTADAGSRGFVEEQVLIGRPASGQLLIQVEIRPGATNVGSGAPLLAGDYADVLRVTMEPQ